MLEGELLLVSWSKGKSAGIIGGSGAAGAGIGALAGGVVGLIYNRKTHKKWSANIETS